MQDPGSRIQRRREAKGPLRAMVVRGPRLVASELRGREPVRGQRVTGLQKSLQKELGGIPNASEHPGRRVRLSKEFGAEVELSP